MADSPRRVTVTGRLVLDDRIEPGRIVIEDGRIEAVEPDPSASAGPLIAPGFVDVHVHGWGGFEAMGEPADLDGMARALLGRGVTSFLPTAVTASMQRLTGFAKRVREWMPSAPADGAEPLGFNLEGPFLSQAMKGAQDPDHILDPVDPASGALDPLVDGLCLMTVAPERPGALALIRWLRDRGVVVSLGHSAANLEEARAGHAAGATNTTHLFNGMARFEHRAPGLAIAALTDDEVFVELIADGHHVDRAVWPIVARTKPAERLVLVSDATSLAGTDTKRGSLGAMEVQIEGDRCTLVSTGGLAGSVIALDTAVRNLVASGVPLPQASAAASRNPLAMLGIQGRGRIADGQRADLVELDDDLSVHRVMRDGEWR